MTQSYIDYLCDVIGGKEKKRQCTGYGWQPHEVADYVLTFGKHYFSYSCSKCGFGTGGSLSEGDFEKLMKAQFGNSVSASLNETGDKKEEQQ